MSCERIDRKAKFWHFQKFKFYDRPNDLDISGVCRLHDEEPYLSDANEFHPDKTDADVEVDSTI